MCGVMGFQVVRPERRIPPMMSVLISYMEERGNHAWGCWTKTKGVQKGIGPFTRNGPPARSFKGTTSMFGHCRFATVGANTARNAHPFTSGKITGIHNGSVSNYEELNREYERDFQVDSEHIFAHIDQDEKLSEIHGYGTCIYHNAEHPERTYLFHWNSGQLKAAQLYFDSGEVLGSAWASTESALERALNSAGFRKYEMWDIPEDRLHYFEEGKLFTVDGKMDFGFRATLGRWPSTTHHHADGRKASGGKAVAGKTELIRDSTDMEQISSVPLPRITLISQELMKAGVVSQCSDCQKGGVFTITFNDTGIQLCCPCWIKWRREEQDAVEALKNEQIREDFKKRTLINPDNDKDLVVWTDRSGDVHMEQVR